MTIGIGVWAFLVYILAILVWMLVVKRNIAEAMLVGLVVISLFNGPANIVNTLWTSIYSASMESSFLATMLFLMMAVVMTKTGIIEKLVELLNSMIGRVRGGAAYVSVCASFLFGLVSGNAIANCSTVGAITVPWMKDSGWPKPVAATMNAGNAGVGQSMPSCSALYLLVGLAEVSAVVSVGDAYVACLCAGAINIVLWVPIVVCLICFIVGRKNLPKNAGGWVDLLKSCHSSFCTVGGVLLFALAASNVLNAVGFDQDLALILQSLSLPGVLMVILTCIMIALVAGPLSAVATTAAVGQVAYSVFVDAGIAPICAVVAFMICISTEGASPPSSSPIFISCGLAEVKDPKVIFRPLITDYVLPLLGVAVLVAYGILPVIR